MAAKTGPGMKGEREIERLQSVYREYMPRVAARWSPENRGNQAILAELERRVSRMLSGSGLVPLGERRVLDVGCGHGHFLGLLQSLGARASNLHGVDLLAERIAYARSHHPGIRFSVGNAGELAYPDHFFDLVLLFSVLTSILDPEMRKRVAAEVTRVLKPGGAILWYDFRFDDPWNPNVRGVRRTEIATYFPDCRRRLQSVTLLPPLARRLGPFTSVLYPLLARVPTLRTHNLGLLEDLRAPGSGGDPA